ncbi:chalcone-flavanone isomerase-domain-containing protein [Podospora australis]|uniref:Chalcone-flavanone isomerase-domain-containing protein n=1 Tax=Podospora australis TaxID=1536484 RepID=A0AAN6X3C6_9PEZI|nr:chalcone-flavanone isomerase-domain-containing protein [Podospora australis]
MFRQPVLRQLARPSPSAATANLLRIPHHVPRRTLLLGRAKAHRSGAVDSLNVQNLRQKSDDYQRHKRIFLWNGLILCLVFGLYTGYKLVEAIKKQPVKADANLPSSDPLAGSDAADRKVVVLDEEGREIVPTGNKTIPSFPRTLSLPAYTAPITATETAPSSEPSTVVATPETTEYTLVGLGTRTVTFIGIQVYVVGYYIATSDIAALQSALVKKVNPIATTLVPGERDELRAALNDPVEGGKLWDELLASGIPARSAFRVVPVRDTDFHHLRDGFVRAIQHRAPELTGGPAAAAGVGGRANSDDAFGEAMRQFRAVFNRGKVPQRKELLLSRDATGKLSITYDGGKKAGGRQLIGVVEDERVSRALWLNWLGGKQVASEPARKSIVEGVMEFVERPIGTVAAQVVPRVL